MVINKKVSEIYKLCVLQVMFSSLKFVSFRSIISSQIILSTMLAKYFPFSQLHVAGFQT